MNLTDHSLSSTTITGSRRAKRQRRIRAHSTPGQVAGAATNNAGLAAHRLPAACPTALPRSSPCPGTPILPETPDDSTAAVSSPDNGPCFKSRAFARFIASRPELIHIRTRVKSPGQNGVRERAFKSLKYEHLYRHEIDDGHQLATESESYRQLFNTVRPHQTLAGRRPLDVHLNACQTPQTPKSTEPETLPLS